MEQEDKKPPFDKNSYMRKWYGVNKKMKQCECGCILVASGYSGHLKTEKHKNCMIKNNENVIDEINRLEMFIVKLKKIEADKIKAPIAINTI